ncbi:polyphosphate kinase 1 [Leptospira sp. 2 VSF19]|uniref:Polyphosphate kinase n=2 Tax=Leptospira soteropolitanensis TaxID=2950025 RepID=A0AAW5VPZ7_9LEPT|nr:polyphosphate kinase 1 [Leptospira soteropolitanensis]MCW7501713.1 polyphosphate kinase 1 [Leptospira soteropolitanensis]MCW7523867.1 polyphosphate kinase 1 [Leptospira soteropolitanensis]MCW7527732.1 polyphosphate kinase 1 [Leptospira soteropolitanensis]MCW7531683.1 polyphosphate kinase 1 [Leptospira soteropolitanensis]
MTASPTEKIELGNQNIFFDRELSWVDFNHRVLEESFDKENPLLERLKFLCITESNLDEFFMVRVAGLLNLKNAGIEERSLNGKRTSETIAELYSKVGQFVKRQYESLDEILVELKENKIVVVQDPSELAGDDIQFVKNYYKREVSSILTPLAIDPSHPFPHILNRTLNLGITLYSDDDKNKAKELFAIVQVPSVLPRFLQLPPNKDTDVRRYFPLEEIIKLHLGDLFYGMNVKQIHTFKIVRDADISINEEQNIGDLLTTMKNELKNRMWGDAVRLDVHAGAGHIKELLRGLLELEEYQVMEIPTLLSLNDMMFFQSLEKTSHLKYSYPVPKSGFAAKKSESIFSEIRKNDHLLHHPYESFKSIEDMLKIASQDPKVLAIKMTLYRTSGDSPIIQFLGEAAENGKQVTVLVELKARFDEERNIRWAKKLEDSGVHVVYGVVGLKIHCKMLLIVRREDDKLNRYVHLGTGNYNSTTARFYTDLSLFTANPEITEDVAILFNTITSSGKMPRLSKIYAAPTFLKEEFLHLIQRETDNAKNGKQARVIFKMNSLVDPDVILKLYEASQAGVKIDLIIRGICCLRPGIPGVSDRINVRSIVGRYLEHSRIYSFENGGKPEVYLASADCMPRNFLRRIEVMFPILQDKHRKRIAKILELLLRDNTQARVLESDGTYTRLTPGDDDPAVNSQIDMVDI